MLKMLILLGAVIAACAAMVLLIISWRNRNRRRLSRARRAGDYAERKSQWRTHLDQNQSRRSRRTADKSESGE